MMKQFYALYGLVVHLGEVEAFKDYLKMERYYGIFDIILTMF